MSSMRRSILRGQLKDAGALGKTPFKPTLGGGTNRRGFAKTPMLMTIHKSIAYHQLRVKKDA